MQVKTSLTVISMNSISLLGVLSLHINTKYGFIFVISILKVSYMHGPENGSELGFSPCLLASFLSNGKIVVTVVNCILNKPGVSMKLTWSLILNTKLGQFILENDLSCSFGILTVIMFFNNVAGGRGLKYYIQPFEVCSGVGCIAEMKVSMSLGLQGGWSAVVIG